jgi:hypothetical protein
LANNTFQVKRTSTAGRTPNTTNSANSQYINPGELALNMTDQVLYTSDGTNLIIIGSNTVNHRVSNTLTVNTISANGSVGATNQVLTSNGSTVYWSTPTGGGASVTISDTAPSSPSAGNLWYSSATGDTYIYYNNQWVSINETYLGAPVNTPLFTGLATFSNGINVVGNVTYSNVTFTNMPNFSNSTFTNVIANGTITANGTTGTAGYVLASGGSSSNVYWTQISGNIDYGLVTGSVTGSADYGSIL